MDAGKTGAYLAALRKARGMTQQEAADQLGVSNKTVSKWENGAGLPDITVLPALAELYGVTADDILAGETLRGRPAEAQGPARRRLLLLRLRTRFDLCFIGSLALGVLAAFRVAYVSLAAWPLSVGLLWIGYVLAVHPARYGDISLDAKIWENLYRKLLDRGIPLVFMNGNYPELTGTTAVLDDNYNGGGLCGDAVLRHHASLEAAALRRGAGAAVRRAGAGPAPPGGGGCLFAVDTGAAAANAPPERRLPAADPAALAGVAGVGGTSGGAVVPGGRPAGPGVGALDRPIWGRAGPKRFPGELDHPAGAAGGGCGTLAPAAAGGADRRRRLRGWRAGLDAATLEKAPPPSCGGGRNMIESLRRRIRGEVYVSLYFL